MVSARRELSASPLIAKYRSSGGGILMKASRSATRKKRGDDGTAQDCGRDLIQRAFDPDG
jgi:hypothetical protein